MVGSPVLALEPCDDITPDVIAILAEFSITHLPSPTAGLVLSVINRDPANDCVAQDAIAV